MVTELKKSEYRAFLEFTLELYKLEDVRKVLSLIVDHAVSLVPSDRSTLYLCDRNKGELYSEFYHGAPTRAIRLSIDDSSVAGYCGKRKQLINIKDAYRINARRYPDLKFDPSFDKLNFYKTKSILCAPLLDQNGRLHGVLSLLNSKGKAGFTKKDERMIEFIARHAAIAVTRLQRQEMARVFSQEDQVLMSGAKNLFVVFFDIIEYTRLVELHGDKKMKQFIQAWEEDHIRLINSYGGIYVKSVGDEIMSLFGYDPLLSESLINRDDTKENQTVEKGQSASIKLQHFERIKRQLSNQENLRPLILEYERWYEKNRQRMDERQTDDAERFRRQLWAENVIRFLIRAQKNLNRLNHSLFLKKIVGEEKAHLLFMKGGAEFGPVIVGFDFYGRIDVSGDIVNTASRITGQGMKPSIVTGVVEQPVLIGPNLYQCLPQTGFINTSMSLVRLKGKKDPVNVSSIDSLISFENRSGIPKKRFSDFQAYISDRIEELDQVQQRVLPFNYASYRIEEKDKYLVDHSKRVAANALHIIDLINTQGLEHAVSIDSEKTKNTVIAALLHDIGRHSLNDQVKGFMDPTKSVQVLNQEEKEGFNRLIGSFGCSILESINALRGYSYFVKCAHLHFNGVYFSTIQGDYPAGNQIPIESRIVSAANAIDSILNETPFREGLSISSLIRIFSIDVDDGRFHTRVQRFDPFITALVIEYYQKTEQHMG